MKTLKTIALAILTMSFFHNCTYVKNKMNGRDIYVIPLNRYPDPISHLEKGTPLRLIAFAFGNESDKDHTYYHQFLAINQTTGDTIRVLTQLISVGADNTYTTPTLYNHDKGIETATFVPKDSSFDMLMNINALGDKPDTSALNKLQEKNNAADMVVMVKGVRLFENSHYKTVVGALHFDDQPW